jgi:hypothetical protein
MPCDSGYLRPTEREAHYRLTAQLLAFVLDDLARSVPSSVRSAAEDCYGKNTDYTPDLCALLKGLDPARREALIYGDARSESRRRLASWWERHEAADRTREEDERIAAERTRLRQEGLSKLTPAEREALGLS